MSIDTQERVELDPITDEFPLEAEFFHEEMEPTTESRHPSLSDEALAQDLITARRFARKFATGSLPAEDLAASVMFRIAKRGEMPEDVEERRKLITVIARNLAINNSRSTWHTYWNTHHPVDEISERLPIATTGPEDTVVNADYSDELKQALDAMLPQHRTIFEMYALEGYSYKEIANKLRIPVDTVSSSISRARKKGQKVLAACAGQQG